jgi:hypothetical protein
MDSVLLPLSGTTTISVPTQHPTQLGRWSVDMPDRPLPHLTTYDQDGNPGTVNLHDLLRGHTVAGVGPISDQDFSDRTPDWIPPNDET